MEVYCLFMLNLHDPWDRNFHALEEGFFKLFKSSCRVRIPLTRIYKCYRFLCMWSGSLIKGHTVIRISIRIRNLWIFFYEISMFSLKSWRIAILYYRIGCRSRYRTWYLCEYVSQRGGLNMWQLRTKSGSRVLGTYSTNLLWHTWRKTFCGPGSFLCRK
jgi:hypothetical protein